MFGIGEALSIGGALLGGLGGKSKTSVASAPQSGFATLPAEVQDAWLKTYLPDVLKNYDKPRTPIPLMRAQAPSTPFDSAELYNLQQFSDAVGGYFSPLGQPAQQVYNPQAAPAADPNAAADADLERLARDRILLDASRNTGTQAAQYRGWLETFTPEQLRELGRALKSPPRGTSFGESGSAVDYLKAQGKWKWNTPT